jgi:hypothetical protein
VWGVRCIDPRFLDLGTSLRWAVSFTPRRKRPPPRCPLQRRLRGPPEHVWTTWRSDNSYPHRDRNPDPSVVQSVASRYTKTYVITGFMFWRSLIIDVLFSDGCAEWLRAMLPTLRRCALPPHTPRPRWRGSMYLGNVGNTAHDHMVQPSKNRINICNIQRNAKYKEYTCATIYGYLLVALGALAMKSYKNTPPSIALSVCLFIRSNSRSVNWIFTKSENAGYY